jgi:hypothetical protein
MRFFIPVSRTPINMECYTVSDRRKALAGYAEKFPDCEERVCHELIGLWWC